jgi:uncharacterized protein (DUF2126 family)
MYRDRYGGDTRRLASLVTRILVRKQALLSSGIVCCTPRRAMPLDLTETRPIEAAFYRSIKAVTSSGSEPFLCD